MKNKGERRRFDKEFKQEVVRLVVEGGRQVSEVARDLDIHPNVIHRWKREYLEDTEYRSLLASTTTSKYERVYLHVLPLTLLAPK